MTTKDEVYRALLAQKGEYMSGEKLASQLNITRAAVWKAVKALCDEGCTIDAASHRGYRLLHDDYNQLTLESLISLPVFFHQNLDSTNSEARRLIASGVKAPFVVIAESQSGGRGRRGRSFLSQKGGIYLSLALPADDHANIETLTTRVAVAVSRAIDSLGFESSIKWVNDIYVGGKKVVGILCEAVMSIEDMRVTEVVVGVGVNYETASFTEELDPIASSLYPHGNAPLSKARFASLEVENMLKVLEEESYIDEYRKKCFILGQEVNVIRGEETRRATALDVDDNAHLIVRYEDGTVESLSSGEVSVRMHA